MGVNFRSAFTKKLHHQADETPARRAGMAGRDRGADPGRRAWRPDDVRQDRHDAGFVFGQAKVLISDVGFYADQSRLARAPVDLRLLDQPFSQSIRQVREKF